MTDALHVFRAPMRSRDDDVDHAEAVGWALAHDVVAVGGRVTGRPEDVPSAQAEISASDERVADRLGRFAAVPVGSFVWTRVPQGDIWLGEIDGPWELDTSREAHRLDLQHTRSCAWLDQPIPAPLLPEGVQQTFARGGRNFQRIATPGVDEATSRLWAELGGY